MALLSLIHCFCCTHYLWGYVFTLLFVLLVLRWFWWGTGNWSLNCFAGVFWLLVFHDSFSWFLGLVCSLWLKQFLIILTSCFYIYKSIKYSGRLVLREELFKETRPWRTLDVIQKYDRPLLDLFEFTELSLMLGIHKPAASKTLLIGSSILSGINRKGLN